jgi:hypothetical protein
VYSFAHKMEEAHRAHADERRDRMLAFEQLFDWFRN